MADHYRPGNSARSQRALAESNRRLRTRRPLNHHAPNLAFAMIAPFLVDAAFREFPWLPVLLDPGDEGDFPEFKQIIGFQGKIGSGSVAVTWEVDDLTIVGAEEHIISAGSSPNRLDLAQPYLFANNDDGQAEWLRPVFTAVEDVTAGSPLSCTPIFETVPV
jgi:hypothetical protein